MTATLPARRLWTREEYERAAELGLFRPEERLELIAGEVVRKMTPQRSPHASGIVYVQEALREVFTRAFVIRVQLPLAIGADSEPEPDVAVVQGAKEDWREQHPSSAELVVEVADTSLAFDRSTKAGLYASAGIQEYWIVNLEDRVLEVHREPGPIVSRPFGCDYHSVTRHMVTDAVSPLAAPGSSVKVSDLIP